MEDRLDVVRTGRQVVQAVPAQVTDPLAGGGPQRHVVGQTVCVALGDAIEVAHGGTRGDGSPCCIIHRGRAARGVPAGGPSCPSVPTTGQPNLSGTWSGSGGERVEIRGVCSFYVKNYKSYTGRNPKTGEKVTIRPKKLPFFKSGKELKERVDY